MSELNMQPVRKRYKTLTIRPRRHLAPYHTRLVDSRAVAANKIARFWRYYSRCRPSNNVEEDKRGERGFQRKEGKNIICCITQDRIPTSMCFKFFSLSTGHVHVYSLPDLVGYFKASGCFKCPMTREEFPQTTIRRLSLKAYSLGIPALNLPGLFLMRDTILDRRIERENRLLAIENSCGIAMTECLDTCSNFSMTTVQAMHELINYLIPEWKQLVDDYALFSADDCRSMLATDRDKLRRLRSVDVANPHGLIEYVCDAIEQKLTQIETMSRRASLYVPRLPPVDDTDVDHEATLSRLSHRLFQTLSHPTATILDFSDLPPVSHIGGVSIQIRPPSEDRNF